MAGFSAPHHIAASHLSLNVTVMMIVMITLMRILKRVMTAIPSVISGAALANVFERGEYDEIVYRSKAGFS